MTGLESATQRARSIARRLEVEFPGTAQSLCALDHDSAFQLLAATILSAQCTDERVNMVTPNLFAAYSTAQALAGAKQLDVEELIHSTGFFRAKAANLIGMASGVIERFGGEVPSAMEDLVTLPGVGRKTANVLRSVCFDLPGLPVDTHVGRLARRLDLVRTDDPVKAELRLNKLFLPHERGVVSLRLILHGRKTCTARVMHCEHCVLIDLCPTGRRRIGDVSS